MSKNIKKGVFLRNQTEVHKGRAIATDSSTLDSLAKSPARLALIYNLIILMLTDSGQFKKNTIFV